MPKNEWEIDDLRFHIFLNRALCFSFGVEMTPAQKALNPPSFFPSSPSPQNPSFSSFTERKRVRESPKKKKSLWKACFSNDEEEGKRAEMSCYWKENPRGENWVNHKRIISPAFHLQRLKGAHTAHVMR